MSASERILRAIIFPKTKKVGCVLLQAVVGGDREVCSLFNNWETGSMAGAKPVSGTLSDWKKLAEKWNHEKEKRSR